MRCLLLALLLAIPACSTATPGLPEEGLRLAVSAVGGLNGKVQGDLDLDHGYGARVQVSRVSTKFPGVEMGLKLGVQQVQFSDIDAGVRSEWDATEAVIAPTMRYYFATGQGDSVRPYLEGFVGYGHMWGRSEVTSAGLTSSDRNDGGGVYGGFGAGLEWALSRDWSLHLGLEQSWANYDFGGETDMRSREAMGLAGMTFTF